LALEQDQMDKIIFLIAGIFLVSGCASTQPAARPSESMGAQMEAAKKVVGAMSPDKGSVEKYSPVTGKHYSGALEYEPGTGVKLIPVEE
jgi:hypothetical protein